MKFANLIGYTIRWIKGGQKGDDEVIIYADNLIVTLNHRQDCCENVSVEEVHGDLNDLIGLPLVEAEEVVKVVNSVDRVNAFDGSCTWTFYKLGTRKGSVTIRWLGSSNGYYSESVDVDIKWLDIDEYAYQLEMEEKK